MTIEFEKVITNTDTIKGLNPCSNGMKIEYSGLAAGCSRMCLNPCCNGMKIEYYGITGFNRLCVLILVLME